MWLEELGKALHAINAADAEQRGFDDGLAGERPDHTNRMHRKSYYRGYHRGQAVAKTRLRNALRKHLEGKITALLERGK